MDKLCVAYLSKASLTYMPPLIGLSAHRLQIGYGGEPVLTDVDVRLAPGKVTVLIGPNGSGKSTLLRGLSTLLPLMAGEVHVGESPLHSLTPRELARELVESIRITTTGDVEIAWRPVVEDAGAMGAPAVQAGELSAGIHAAA